MSSDLQDLMFIMDLGLLGSPWVFVILGIVGALDVVQFPPEVLLASGCLPFPGW